MSSFLSNAKVAFAAGVYNEAVFESLDWVLDQASQRGLHIILPIEVTFSSKP